MLRTVLPTGDALGDDLVELSVATENLQFAERVNRDLLVDDQVCSVASKITGEGLC